jgi:hypothetical protein
MIGSIIPVAIFEGIVQSNHQEMLEFYHNRLLTPKGIQYNMKAAV